MFNVTDKVAAEDGTERLCEERVYVQVGVGDEETSENEFDGSLMPSPEGPTAATRAS